MNNEFENQWLEGETVKAASEEATSVAQANTAANQAADAEYSDAHNALDAAK